MSAAEQPKDRAEVERGQFARLRALLAALESSNAFYAKKLSSLGKIVSLEDFSARAPFTAKSELIEDQRAHPPFGSNLTFPLERYTRYHQTSASTGAPLRWLDTEESWAWMLSNWDRVYDAAGVTRADRIFFAFSFGPFIGFWTAYESGTRRGCLCIPGGGMSSAARLRAIVDNAATVLCCTPTYALRLAGAASEDPAAPVDLARSKIRRIIVAGEPGGSIPGVRKRIEEVWGSARVCDHHGMTEVGPVSYECPSTPGRLHIIDSSYYAEVIDPNTGTVVPAGQTGELVLTTLGRTGSPLVRYRTGDLVRRGPPQACACGQFDFKLEGGILGRADDMVLVRGVNVYPAAIEELVREFAEAVEYRVELFSERNMSELRIQIEPVPGCADAAGLARKIEERLKAALTLRVPVKAVPCGSLPRFEMKAKRWVRLDKP
ncbi:MAG: AMP-binding protein [Planctomycetes bacterium]|nr:AMP-binding protein [Planctomycetota bacterium]